jgi:hypothetical protein
MGNSKNPIETYEFYANPNYEEFEFTRTGINKSAPPIKSNRAKRREEERKMKKNKNNHAPLP